MRASQGACRTASAGRDAKAAISDRSVLVAVVDSRGVCAYAHTHLTLQPLVSVRRARFPPLRTLRRPPDAGTVLALPREEVNSVLRSTSTRAVIGVLVALGLAPSELRLRADEGMWTFDNPPTARLHDDYGFLITPAWLDHLRLSSVRFNDGGSGSFVSPNGLVLTNHHVAAGQLQKLSTPEKDYLADGFLAVGDLGAGAAELEVLRVEQRYRRRPVGSLLG